MSLLLAEMAEEDEAECNCDQVLALKAQLAELKHELPAEPVYTALVVDGELQRAHIFWSQEAADAYCKGAEDAADNAQAWQWPWTPEMFEGYDDDATDLLLACCAAVQKLQGVTS